MLAVTYAYYKDTYLGSSVTETEFNKFLRLANQYVDNFTFNRASKVVESDDANLVSSLKDCLCGVVDKVSYYNSTDYKVKSSESADKVSVSYLESSLPKTASVDIGNLVDFYLNRYGLTYMGI